METLKTITEVCQIFKEFADERHGLPSASSFKRIVHCAGSLLKERSVVDIQAESDVATSGTAIHDAVANDDNSDLEHGEKMVASRLKELEVQVLDQWKSDFGVEKCEIIREKRFWLHDKQGNELISAKVDFAAISSDGRFCLLADFKSGFKSVEPASSNWQLKVGIATLNKQVKPFEKSRIAIVQHRLQSTVDICDCSAEDVSQFEAEIRFYLNRAKSPDAPRQAGKHCEYCKAMNDCAEYACYSMMPIARAETCNTFKKKDIEARVGVLSLDALAYIESRRTAADNLFKSVQKRLKSLSKEELESIGYELKPSGSNRKIQDLDALWKVLESNKLMDGWEFRSVCKISIGSLEEILIPRIKLMGECAEDQASEKLKSLLAPVVKLEEKAAQLSEIKTK